MPFYPFLVALYPVLALAAYNIHEIALGDIWRPLFVSLLLAGVLLGLAFLLFRDWDRAALVSSLILLFFFSYGQVYAVLKNISLGGVTLFRHRTLGPIWMLLLVGSIYWAGWRARIRSSVTAWLNLLAALLLVYPVLTISSYMVQSTAADSTARQVITSGSGQTEARPDIYYIILDGYARQDALKQETGLDNSDFINALKQRGFYVASCAQSNYAHTRPSLASSLNYQYLDALSASTDERLAALIKHGAVREFLSSRGYSTVAFPTGFSWTEWSDANIYPRPQYQADLPTEFENLVLGASLLRIPLDLGKLDWASESNTERYRQRVLSTLQNMKKIPEIKEPTFTFAHIVIPHVPYVFGPNGEAVNNKAGGSSNVVGYRDQVEFINKEILKVIDAILAGSKTPPIIILQGDHGAPVDIGTKELRMRNLNAYYSPRAESKLYPSISPVNSFRVIFDAYFGQDLPLLPDRSYYSEPVPPYDFEPIANSCPETP